MPAFFSHRRGAVYRVTSQSDAGGPKPFRIMMAGLDDITSTETNAIITQAAIVARGNFQFLHTLNETIYAYVFGDRIGELRVGGICFAHPCNGQPSGMQQINSDYHNNKLSKRGQSVHISFGEVDYKGLLVGMNIDIADPERNLGQWMLSFNTFPGNRQ